MTPIIHDVLADVADLPPDIAAAWQGHYQRIFPTMVERGQIAMSVTGALALHPDLFDGIEWLPEARIALSQAVARRAATETGVVERAAERRARRNAKRAEIAARQALTRRV